MEKIAINTGVDSRFLENVITRDISTQASIFDLIDNSIDAAKESLISDGLIKFDEYGMPDDYSGFHITIKIESNSFKILDNCFGINEHVLSLDTLIVGKESDHSFGLGRYGIGLKRALLKFGSDYSLLTDTSENSLKLHFNNDMLSSGNKIFGLKLKSKGRKRTLFIVNNLKPLVKKEFSNTAWQDKLKLELSQRYAIFLKKGLKITLKLPLLKPVSIIGRFPSIIDNAEIPACKNTIESHEVYITIEYGLHAAYKLGGGYGANKSDDITPFGWYVVCNDRVIEIAIRNGTDYGWKQNWHNEYNGFIGILRFDCKQVEHLPWDSTKTKITTDSLVFLAIKEELEMCSHSFRSVKKKYLTNQRKQKVISGKVGIETKAGLTTNIEANGLEKDKLSVEGVTKGLKPKTSSSDAIKPIKPAKHTQQWNNLLPKEFIQPENNWILNNLIIEAKIIVINDLPHAASLLYRSILEESLSHFIKEKFNLDAIREHYYTKGEGKGKEHNDEYKKNISVTLAMMIHWLIDNDDVFPKDKKNKLKSSTTKAKGDIKDLNKAVHGQIVVDRNKISSIRNNSFELVEYFIFASR